MKIQELQQRELEHLRTAEHGSSLEVYLIKNGWEDLSGGITAYSDVWGKPGSKWVIKILREATMPSNTEFQCTIRWLRWAQKSHHTNPHIPVVAYVKTVPNEYTGDERAYMAVIERLEDVMTYKWERSGDKKNDAFMMAAQYTLGLTGVLNWTEESLDTVFMDIIAEVGAAKEIKNANEYMGYPAYDGPEESEEYLRWLSVISRKTGLRPDLARRMVKYGAFKGHQLSKVISAVMDMGCTLDLHAGNVMVRPSTNTLVITDPVKG